MTEHEITAINYSNTHRPQFLNSLVELLSIPSISTSPDHTSFMLEAANWVANQLTSLGFTNVKVVPTPRHPIVYGQRIVDPTLPTVLIYGHYDVQPAEPLDLWVFDPFTPTQRGDNLFARGASDMKGQVVATLSAVQSILSSGEFPVNVKYIVEGEEEIGSPNLTAFLHENKDLLACSFALNPDSGMVGAEIPTIVYALRGLAYFELRVYGPAHDLHSGLFGGVVHNPAIVLSELIAGMHNSQGQITLPGFYQRVIPLDPEERADLAQLPMSDEFYLTNTGAPVLYGEDGFTAQERVGARPTLDVNGLYSGFTGAGSKTVIPAWAMAKISMRLVPDQDPVEVQAQLVQYLEQKAPKTVRWELTSFANSPAAVTDRNHPAVSALKDALQTVWGTPPVFKREGGSIPVVLDMQKILGVDSVLTGFGLPDDNLHAPNEKLHLPTWYKGIDALVHFFFNLKERL
jgi:acetylornithine deacetylase/succinyl-diaminopimelate desuccinylase-like protein